VTTILEEKIRNLINRDGPMTFARFMEIALFDPEDGYYVRGKAAGDYYTSPAAHPAFGALLALQLEQMWEVMDKPGGFTVVEIGAGRGLLAEDILDFAAKWSPSFYEALRLVSIERGGQPVAGARPAVPFSPTAAIDHSAKSHPVKSNALPLKSVSGCLLSNELVDAFAVHRLVKRDGNIREIFVGLEGEAFTEITGEPSSAELKKYLAEQGIEMEEGQTVEVNLEALKWIRDVSTSLEAGYVITIDYGHEAGLLYSRRFFQGTLLCYHMHSYTDNPYVRVGQQDITSHVNFTALMKEGQKLGLKTAGFTVQGRFLRNLGLNVLLNGLTKLGLPQSEYYANQMSMRNLVSPQGMGDFKVLIQGKGVRDLSLHGLTPDNELVEKLRRENVPLPLLKPGRLSLLYASYPDYYSPLQNPL